MPDTYTSQFSGEEIDAALRAAQIISGADTPAALRKKLEIRGDTIPVSAEDSTLISEALTKIPTTSGGGVNPNLLDNWFFGNPVNQKEGKIIPAGKSYYTTPDIALPEVGKTDKAYPVIEIKNYSGYGQRASISIDGTVYYAWDQDAVQGYTGSNTYCIDRFICYSLNINISNSCLKLSSAEYWYSRIGQKIEPHLLNALSGKQVTMTALLKSAKAGQVKISLYDSTDNVSSDTEKIETTTGDVQLVTTTFTIPPSYSNHKVEALFYSDYLKNGQETELYALKLELGGKQTLAHEENGVWVLNEVPNFGEQLRRCQLYRWRFCPAEYVGSAIAFGISANAVRALIYLPEQMRTNPTLNFNKNTGLFLTGVDGDIFGMTLALAWTSPNSICVEFQKSGAFAPNSVYFVRGDGSSAIDISADL